MEAAKPFTASNSKDASSAPSIFHQLFDLVTRLRSEAILGAAGLCSPPSSPHWSCPAFLFQVPLPAPRHLLNCSEFPSKALASLKSPSQSPAQKHESLTLTPAHQHGGGSPHPWPDRTLQQDLPFASATTRAVVDKLGATVGKSGKALNLVHQPCLVWEYTHLEWSTARGTWAQAMSYWLSKCKGRQTIRMCGFPSPHCHLADGKAYKEIGSFLRSSLSFVGISHLFNHLQARTWFLQEARSSVI